MKFKSFPNALTIVVAFILAAGILTYLIPKGQYERVIDPETQREVVVAGSYKQVDREHLTPFEILVCIPRGIINGGEVVVLIFMVGGCFYIVDKTGAMKAGVSRLVSKMKGKEELTLVMVGFLFAAGGATQGLQEEIIPLFPILLVLTRKIGYPPFITIGMSYGAAVIGSTFSPINPFGVVIAQKVAEVPFLTAVIFRLIIFCFAFALWMGMLIRYGNKNRLTKELETETSTVRISTTHAVILFLIMIAFMLVIYGMLMRGWGFNEISTEFFVLGIVIGLIGRMGINNTFIAFGEGFKEMTYAAMIVGLAYGISLVLKEGIIIDTIIYSFFTPLQNIPPFLSAIGMMGSQAALHLFVPSYSGQAVLTMPILAPLSDLLGLSRDVCVMAYQYGAIFMDMIIPTNGALMAILAIAQVSFDDWVRFVLKKMILLYAFCAVVLVLVIAIG